MTVTRDGESGGPDAVTGSVRAAALRGRVPQSAVPTQGGPSFPPSNPSFPPAGPGFPPSHPSFPPPGPGRGPHGPNSAAQRSPLLTPQGRPTPSHPSGEQTPLGGDEQSDLRARLTTWWAGVRAFAAKPTGRWTLLGAGALVQAFLLVSAVLWWVSGTSTISATSATPLTWTGIVYDVGAAGVNLRDATKVDPANARDTAARGSRLAVQCGQTGDVVAKGTVHTATWLKTTDGLFVSMLYVRVPGRQSIPSCADSRVDAPLLALADPANPDLPPPPSTSSDGVDGSASTPAGGHSRAVAAAGPARAAAAPVATGVPAMPKAVAPPPASTPVGKGSGTPTMPTLTSAPPSSGTQVTVDYDHSADHVDPNVTPVG